MYRLYYYDEGVPYPVLYILGKLGVLLAANTYVFQCILGVLGAGGRAHAPRSAEAAAPRVWTEWRWGWAGCYGHRLGCETMRSAAIQTFFCILGPNWELGI